MGTKTIILQRAAPGDVSKLLKLMHKVHAQHFADLPPIVDRFTLPWITDIVCFGVVFTATLEGRLVGSIGLSITNEPWNHYEKFLQSQWMNVLDAYAECGVRDKLIIKAREEAKKQKYDMRLDIPEYLYCNGDQEARTVDRNYFFNRAAYGD